LKKAIPLLTSFILVANWFTPAASGAVKIGAACNRAGTTSIVSGIKYTCVKTGKKLIWSKGVVIAEAKPTPSPTLSPKSSPTPFPTETPSPSPSSAPIVDYTKMHSTDDGYFTEFSDPCSFDKNPPPEWKAFQDYYYGYNRCVGQLKLGKYFLGNSRPTSGLSTNANYQNVNECKIQIPDRNSNLAIGFEQPGTQRAIFREEKKYPSPKTVFQLIGIYADDTAKPTKSPREDYSKYLNFLKEWIEYSSDGESKVEIRYPEEYVKIPGNLGDYKVVHTNNWDNSEHQRLNRDVVAAVDPSINFSGANIGIIVAPGGTPLEILKQGALGPLKTAEGQVPFAISEYSDTYSNPNRTIFANLAAPSWWLHELYHAGYGLEDHYGDDTKNVNAEYGLGWWSLMNPTSGDLTIWEKWILGFTLDSQVHCITGNGTSTHWISPSGVKTNEKKAVVVKISNSKVIVIESIRPASLHYKIPKSSEGVLVYTVDLLVKNRDYGMKLVLPKNRNPNQGPFFLAEAPLRVGESVSTDGVTITIVESGTYGDVIKVER